jgi:hypothetical protein
MGKKTVITYIAGKLDDGKSYGGRSAIAQNLSRFLEAPIHRVDERELQEVGECHSGKRGTGNEACS